MVTSLYTADVQLNPGKEAKRCLIVYNKENGILIIDGGLFSLSFESTDDLMKSGVIITDKRHIGDITL
jgi:hypothetical protein